MQARNAGALQESYACGPNSDRILSVLMKNQRRRFNVVLRPEPEGGSTVMLPALPGCVTYGRTLAEARAMVRDAITGYIASLQKHNEPIPSYEDTLVASLDLEYVETAGS